MHTIHYMPKKCSVLTKTARDSGWLVNMKLNLRPLVITITLKDHNSRILLPRRQRKLPVSSSIDKKRIKPYAIHCDSANALGWYHCGFPVSVGGIWSPATLRWVVCINNIQLTAKIQGFPAEHQCYSLHLSVGLVLWLFSIHLCYD